MDGLDLKQMTSMVKIIAEEKNLPEEVVLGIIEAAIAAAWRKDNGDKEMNVRATLNLNTGEAYVYVAREVIEDEVAYNPAIEIPLAEAGKGKKLGDIVEVKFDMPVVAHMLEHNVAFTRGPVLLARDSRFNDGDLSEPFRCGIKDGQTMPTFAAVRTTSDDFWMAFSATLSIGSHSENPEASNPTTVFFCDYASAGNTWRRDAPTAGPSPAQRIRGFPRSSSSYSGCRRSNKAPPVRPRSRAGQAWPQGPHRTASPSPPRTRGGSQSAQA